MKGLTTDSPRSEPLLSEVKEIYRHEYLRPIHCVLCNRKGVATSEVHRAMTSAEITHSSFISTSKVTRGISGQHPQKFLFGELFLPGFPFKKTSAQSPAVARDRRWKMLFLGLRTGLGSAFIIDGILASTELGHLPYKKGTFEEYVEIRTSSFMFSSLALRCTSLSISSIREQACFGSILSIMY